VDSNPQPPESEAGDGFYRYYVLAILTLIFVFSIADRMVMSILIEDIRAEFALSDTSVGLLVGLAFTMFYVVLGVPVARLADRSNRKAILAIAVSLWSAMTALCGAATSFATLLLARIGVGVGEAGGSPPSISLIADYFRPAELSRAMGLYSIGATAGTVLGLMAGGHIAEAYGWRSVFVVLGLPGIVLGLITFFTVREPRRGRFAPAVPNAEPADGSIWADLLGLFRNAAYIRTMLAMAAAMICAYAFAIWLAPAILRNFNQPVATVGWYLGIAYAAGGVPGLLIGGYLADRLARHDERWRAWLGAIATAVATPFLCATLLVTDFTAMLVLYAIGFGFLASVQAGSLAIMQSRVLPGRRALAASLSLLVTNISGQALGPLVVGVLSDRMQPAFGPLALNYAVIGTSAACLALATALYVWAARAIPSAD
jgi:predicted MFS family arabinose efflux permease